MRGLTLFVLSVGVRGIRLFFCPFTEVHEVVASDSGNGEMQVEQDGEKVQVKQKEVPTGDFGPWMMVQTRRSRRNRKVTAEDQAGLNVEKSSGSRYAVLYKDGKKTHDSVSEDNGGRKIGKEISREGGHFKKEKRWLTITRDFRGTNCLSYPREDNQEGMEIIQEL